MVESKSKYKMLKYISLLIPAIGLTMFGFHTYFLSNLVGGFYCLISILYLKNISQQKCPKYILIILYLLLTINVIVFLSPFFLALLWGER